MKKQTTSALYKNIDNQFFTFEELKEKIKDKQTDKHKKLICIYSTDKKGQHSYIQSAKDYGYEVLLMDNPFIDVHFMQFMEQKETDITFVRVDSDTVDNLVQTEDKKESVLSEKQQEKVKTLFTEMSERRKK